LKSLNKQASLQPGNISVQNSDIHNISDQFGEQKRNQLHDLAKSQQYSDQKIITSRYLKE